MRNTYVVKAKLSTNVKLAQSTGLDYLFDSKWKFYILFRLDLGINIEPLLVYSTGAAATPPSPTTAAALFYLRLVLETPNLVHTLGWATQAF